MNKLKQLVSLILENYSIPPSIISVFAVLLSTRFDVWTRYTEAERFQLTLITVLFITAIHLAIDAISLIISWVKEKRQQQQ